MELEEILNEIENLPGFFARWSMGAKHKTSDKDITFLFYSEEDAMEAMNFAKKYIDYLKENKTTLYFGTKKDYEDFNLRSYYVGQDGIGDDYGWGTLASSIRLSYMISTMDNIHTVDEVEFRKFVNEIKDKLSNTIVPLNESYELYLTAKWGSFFEYLLKGDDSKLAKATLRLLYSLLSMDDGKFRDSYEDIVRDAHLLNMGYLLYSLDDTEQLFDKTLRVKKGLEKFTDEERKKLEHLFLVTGGFLEQYAAYHNLLEEDTVKNRIKDYVKKKIEVYGGLEEVIKILSDKISMKEYSQVLIYVTDLIHLLDERHTDFIDKLISMYDEEFSYNKIVNSVQVPAVYHISNYYKLKYKKRDLTPEEIDKAIHMVIESKQHPSLNVYIARGIDRRDLFTKFILSDLFYYKVLVGGYSDKSEAKKLINFSLYFDPFNEEKIKLAMKIYGSPYEFRSLNSLIHDRTTEFARVYRMILRKGLEIRKNDEILALKNLISRREREIKENYEDKLDIYYVKETNELLKAIVEDVSKNLEHTATNMIQKINEISNRKVKDPGTLIRKIYQKFSEDVYKSEIAIMKILGIEHLSIIEGL